jgi:hypothetical protein
MVPFLLIAAAAAAQAHWVPLNSTQAKQAQGQVAPAPSSPPAPVVVPAPGSLMAGPGPSAPVTAQVARFLPAGTLVSLTPLEELTSKHMREGTQYAFMVVTDVVDNGVVVIPRGSKAIGIVTMQTGRAVGGKSGKFDISFQSVAANGVTFPLSGVHRAEGKGNTLGALFGSIIISGHSAVMLPGDVVMAFTRDRTAY